MSNNNTAAKAASTAASIPNKSFNNTRLPVTNTNIPVVQSSSSTPNPNSVSSDIKTLQITADGKTYTVTVKENLSQGGARSRRHKKRAYKKTHRRNRRY